MHLTRKVTIWEICELHEDEGTPVDNVIGAIKSYGVDGIYEIEGIDPEWDILYDTTEEISVEKNGGCSTIELYDDGGNLLWENSNYKNERNEMEN